MSDLVQVWLIPVEVPPDGAADVLDDSERARAAAFAKPRDRQVFTVAHAALRILAARALNTRPAELAWIMSPNGKPRLAAPWSALETSLSHSADMIAVALSTGRAVGVDVQDLVPGLDTVGLSARFFPPDEAGYVAGGRDASTRADRFARLWTRKEAVVKAAGGRLWPNLRIPVRSSDVVMLHRVTDVTAPASYRAAVALTGEAWFTVTRPSPPW